MGLHYSVQNYDAIIGTEAAPVTLTTGYTDNTITLDPAGMSELTFYVQYTPGAGGGGNSIQLKVDSKSDKSSSNYYQDVTAAAATGTVTLSQANYTFVGAVAATSYRVRFLHPVADKTVKVSIKETVVGGSAGTAFVGILMSGQ